MTVDKTLVAPSTRPRGRPRGRLANVAVVAVTAVVVIGLAYLANGPVKAAGVTPVDVTGVSTGAGPVIGNAAPDLVATTVDGKAIRLSDYIGSPIWLTFGASWCQPCRAENPDIQAAYERYRDRGVVVVQVYMSEDSPTITDYAGRVGLTYVKVPDPDTSLAAEYRILGIPSHFFIDKAGVLRQIKVGTLDSGTMDATLDELVR